MVGATSSFGADGTAPPARAVVVPVVVHTWNHSDDDPLLETQGPWRYSLIYLDLTKKTVLYVGPRQHDQGCVRAVQVRLRTCATAHLNRTAR